MAKTTTNNEEMHVCPWWVAYAFDNKLRRMIDPAEKALEKWVGPGMKVLDFGCGLGHYSIGAAKLVGETGVVVAVDLQEKMLKIAMKKARRAGVAGRITPHQCSANGIGYPSKVDFVVAGNVIHETPDCRKALQQIYDVLLPGGGFFFTEPRNHVRADLFAQELKLAAEIGFMIEILPTSFMGRRAYLNK
ncbi:class I SAM-dependent methyltransferase [Maridesulfovibrio zosterae]|uniref:class I SAM-dependent methyltransferase n=1 Tax=Maridesulfovibrio zosterae TaxID=82171 RepID=UPI000410397F|nr:class I SAM-dependent methyltransferase [Maridesulfovibrio zosterae]